jgi:hypothetical protein
MPQKICMSFNNTISKKVNTASNMYSRPSMPMANNMQSSINRFNMNTIFASRGMSCG